MWQDVVTAALVGTRQSLTFTPSDNQLGELLRRLDSTDAEGSLLSTAGALALYQKAGQLPVKDHQPLPKECEPENQPCCSSRAGHQLDLMLKGEHKELLPEWLAATAKARKRVPDINLPELLELGRKQSHLREAILPVLGKRGYWLASQNPDWNYVVGDVEETWQTGSRAARQLLLQKLRAEDPTQARERIAATWSKEKAEDRAAFLETCRRGLSIDDEPFLEAALEDRSKEVRRVAAELLARLPESRLCQRMIERVRPLLTLRQAGKLHIDVTLPQACDQDMNRDLIELPMSNRGEKASLLVQMLSAIPTSSWCQAWGKKPLELVEAAIDNEWQYELLQGWAIATARHQNIDWAEALLAACPLPTVEDGDNVKWHVFYAIFNWDLIEMLPPERQAVFVQKIVQFSRKDLLWALLHKCQHTWSPELSRVVLDSMRHYLETVIADDWRFSLSLKDFARYITPSLVQEAATLSNVVTEGSFWVNAIDEFLAILQFRHEMLQALGSKS